MMSEFGVMSEFVVIVGCGETLLSQCMRVCTHACAG